MKAKKFRFGGISLPTKRWGEDTPGVSPWELHQGYFAGVKAHPEAWKLFRLYEEEFGAADIELRVLSEVV